MTNIEISAKLGKMKFSEIETLFNAYYDRLLASYKPAEKRFNTEPGTINVIAVRCNHLYITNDIERNNDVLMIVENKADDNFRRYIYDVTADPKSRKPGIANLLPQIYLGNIRNHRQILGRPAICQDFDSVWVRRYNSNGIWKDENGLFGINIHDRGGFFNSSLGCIILGSEEEYRNEYKPLLLRSEKKNIPVAVMQDIVFEDLTKNILTN